MTNKQTAREFFEACETGKGWDACQKWCRDGATFSAQADALADVTTIEGYAEWMKGLLGPIPDGHYELKSFAEDEEHHNVTAAAVFHGTQTGETGNGPPTGKTVAADYVYVMDFEGDKISHMTKIWNDGHSLKQLGWA
ncbi:nuclear transport factor 2 family protein [Aliiroseovarius crassostreae]|uniref:ester cyclase n=1 Tax=Aliiroseovarius crassostreae TaxID=154981 RepID=UPI002201E779|nr:nuclear transport factor 2 family protein [Aliiroseovarius crassostreae]UWQ04052.1 nuclear transport factor 2 family protein [Aliiroseovarius crassostreae]UWQ08466.1 nuclear transport factor 2 family protein [Aliiroseovarius crassostreae]UWQ11567.1 nuclear transport factor 2 family protein [Aliiroseovarius crassostreae]